MPYRRSNSPAGASPLRKETCGRSCRRMRRAIDEWLDSRSALSMPSDVAEHIRDCPSCRSYITAWNAVELQMRSLRDEWLSPQDVRTACSGSFRNEWQLTTGQAHVGGRWSTLVSCLWARPARAASVAAAVAVAVGVVLYMTSHIRTNASLARSGVSSRPFGVEAMEAISRDAPVAATR